MRSYFHLTPENLGELYVQSKGGPDYLATSADALVADIQRWLRSSGLDHRLNEASTIASAAFDLVPEFEPAPLPIPSPEEFAWTENQRAGWGDQQPYHGMPASDPRVELATFLTGE